MVHTGQHYASNMSDVFFEEMYILIPDYNLGISGGNHGEMTSKMLAEIEKVLLIAETVWHNNKKVLFDSNLRIKHNEYSVTSSLKSREIVKLIASSMKDIKKEFYKRKLI